MRSCVVLLFFCGISISSANCQQFNSSDELNPDAFLTVPELIKKYGFPLEKHYVITEDGYYLEMHRIPKPGAKSVLIQHGLLASGAEFVVMGPEKGLAYFLSNAGYDVWLGNGRGNRYSRNHKNLTIDSEEFWDFSFNELGKYDLPSMIDYIIKESKNEKIHYIGHSQGTTGFWAMCAIDESYCDKIVLMQALAPVAYFDYVKSPIFLATGVLPDKVLQGLLGKREFLETSELLRLAGQAMCRDEAITQELCSNIVFLIAGYDSDQLNKTTIPVFLGHYPAGASSKQIMHYIQIKKSGEFKMFDYGSKKNVERYGVDIPPKYDLTKVTAPTVLHYSQNDWFAATQDVINLSHQLPNVVKRLIVPNPKFNHLDFLIGIDVIDLLYNDVLQNMKEYD